MVKYKDWRDILCLWQHSISIFMKLLRISLQVGKTEKPTILPVFIWPHRKLPLWSGGEYETKLEIEPLLKFCSLVLTDNNINCRIWVHHYL